MLTLHSHLRQADNPKSRKRLTGKKGLAAGLFVLSAATAHSEITCLAATDKTASVQRETYDQNDEEENDTKAKVQNGFENFTKSVNVLSKNLIAENLTVESEPLEETRAVISTMVKEKATETVKAANLLSQEEYGVLLRIVEAEAGGEDLTGKILVANVVMNRVASEEFPDTVTSVVYEDLQFSPVGDGRINTVTVSDETVEAVSRVLDGEDLSQGAYYFSAREQANPNSMRWFDGNLKWMFKHGAHEFYTFR